MFKFLAIGLLLQLAFLSSIQAQDSIIYFEPPINAFAHGGNLLYKTNVSSSNECAELCLTLGNGQICNSFDYSYLYKTCDLNTKYHDSHLILKPSYNYLFYRRILEQHSVIIHNRYCRVPIECACNIPQIQENFKSYWLIQNDCIECGCVKETVDICSIHETCDCNSHQIQVNKTDINDCTYCSCENELMDYSFYFNSTEIQFSYYLLDIYKINCGDYTPYLDNRGELWSADFGYNSGFVTYDGKILSDNRIYQFARYSNDDLKDLKYYIPVPYYGYYNVSLLFTDLYPYKRAFNIYIEGNYVDIYNSTFTQGNYYEYRTIIHNHITLITDDILELRFEKILRDVKINGIIVDYLLPENSNITDYHYLNITEDNRTPTLCEELLDCDCQANNTISYYSLDKDGHCKCNCLIFINETRYVDVIHYINRTINYTEYIYVNRTVNHTDYIYVNRTVNHTDYIYVNNTEIIEKTVDNSGFSYYKLATILLGAFACILIVILFTTYVVNTNNIRKIKRQIRTVEIMPVRTQVTGYDNPGYDTENLHQEPNVDTASQHRPSYDNPTPYYENAEAEARANTYEVMHPRPKDHRRSIEFYNPITMASYEMENSTDI